VTRSLIKERLTRWKLLSKTKGYYCVVWLLFLAVLFFPGQKICATEFTELIQEQNVIVSQQQNIPNGLSVESGILMNNGVPVIAGGMSVRPIHNPWLMGDGADEEDGHWRTSPTFRDSFQTSPKTQ
jgi:hypothetical protein